MSGPATLMRPEPLGGFGQVHLAAAGFLARYSGGTRTAYALDLRSVLRLVRGPGNAGV